MELDNINFKRFPTTRYQGSKRKILPWIHDSIKSLDFHTALDACGGSGSVSYLLKKMGKSVTYNDKLHFNYLIGKAIIENHGCQLTEEDVEDLKKENLDISCNNIISRKFDGIYYLQDENLWLDNLTTNIVNMNHYEADVLQYKKALAYYALFQASLIKRPFNLFHRNNLKIRTADVVRNFGNKTAWDKPFDNHFSNFVNEVNQLIFNSGKECFSLNQSILEIDPYGYDLIYIDPPYLRRDGSNESSNYLRCYHFLEGLSKYREWESLIDNDSINLRFNKGNEHNDFTKEFVHEIFENIIYEFRKSIIVFSYKKGGIPSIDFIVKILKKNGKKVNTSSMHYQYALNHQNGDAENNREVIIIGI